MEKEKPKTERAWKVVHGWVVELEGIDASPKALLRTREEAEEWAKRLGTKPTALVEVKEVQRVWV